MKPLKIFVEGKSVQGKKGKEAHSTDAAFLRDCIQKWFTKKLDVLENFQYIGGASEIKDMAQFIRIAELHHQVLVIIDANGNYASRKKEIEDFQAKENLQFPFFLFPDNSKSGEVEVLIEQCATNKDILKCFTVYESCIGRSLDIKEKVFAYIRAVTGNAEAAKDKNRNFLNGGYFNLEDACLNPLRDFISKYV